MKRILIILLLFTALTTHAQQDPLYSQYQFNQLMINPAYAGIYNRFAIGAISRFQWAGIDGAPQTNTITAQSALASSRIGLGALILNDRFGVSNNYEIQLASSYNIKINESSKLAMGIQGGWVQFGYDFSGVTMDYLDDPEILSSQTSFSKPNFGAGIMFLHSNFFIGASVPRILNVSVTDGSTQSERYKRHYYATAGIVMEINRTPVKATSLFRSMAGETNSIDITISALLDDVMWAGISVRDFNNFGLLGIFEIGGNLKLGYSFELPTNNLIHGNYGTHEVSILYNIHHSHGRSQDHIIF